MKKKKIILASASPRRKEILNNLGLNFEVIVPDVKEICTGEPIEIVMKNAQKKVEAVSAFCDENAIIIGSDTVVVKDNQVLGKPRTEAEAIKMLSLLSNSVHQVFTSISLLDKKTDKLLNNYSATKVYFKELSEADILSYIRTKEPMDKAGSYGIQGIAAVFIEKIEGDYGTVVGISPSLLYKMLKDLDYTYWQLI